MRNWKRRVGLILLVAVTVLAGMPMTAMAATAHDHDDGTWKKLTMNATKDKVIITASDNTTTELGTTTAGTTVGVILPEGNYYLGETITLPLWFEKGGDSILCLNGQKLEYNNNCILTYINLTMEDCIGTGEVISTGGRALTVGGLAYSPSVKINGGNYTAYNSAISAQGGTIVIDDGHFSGNGEAIYITGLLNSVDVSINGGTFVGGQRMCIDLDDWGKYPCVLNLNGGSFSGAENGLYAKVSHEQSNIYVRDTEISGTKNGIFCESENGNGSLWISAAAQISGNVNDFCLKYNGKIKLLDPLTENTQYSVKKVDFFNDSEAGVITDGWSAKMPNAVVENFFVPGDSNYKILTNASGELELVQILYTVTFDGNGGTGSMNAEEVNGAYSLPANAFIAPEGKQFKAWSVNGVEYLAGKRITISADTIVSAVWEDIPAGDNSPQPPTYTIIEGANSSFKAEESNAITIRADGDFAKFTGVKVNGSILDPSNYTAVSGSTIITLKEEYLNTLPNGTYQLTIVYTDGECSTNFTVAEVSNSTPAPTPTPTPTPTPAPTPVTEPTAGSNSDAVAESPKTGETNMGVFALTMMLISGTGICVYSRRKLAE